MDWVNYVDMNYCNKCGDSLLDHKGCKVKNTQALADLLDDLTQQELTDLIFHCWVNKSITRGAIKGFRKSIGKSNSE